MLKKIVPFMCCCVVPALANADVAYFENGIDATSISYVFDSSYGSDGVSVGTDGIGVLHNVNIGVDETPGSSLEPGYLYVVKNVTSNPYSILSEGGINIAGVVNQLNNFGLVLGGKDAGSVVNLVLGGVVNNGTGKTTFMHVTNIESTDTITSNGGLDIDAKGNFDGKNINLAGTSGSTIKAALDMALSGVIKDESVASVISADTITAAGIQNLSGTMEITSNGALEIGSTAKPVALQNLGTSMVVNAGDVVVNGTIDNSLPGIGTTPSKFNIIANSLTVNGGSSSMASFVNAGDVIANISGATVLAYGFDLSAMQVSNKFDFTTGSFAITNDNGSLWLNNLNDFNLVVTDGASSLKAKEIINGVSNANASMVVRVENGASIEADSITNKGKDLTVSGTSILVGGDIVGNSGTTVIAASDTLTADVILNTSGVMTVSGDEAVNVSSVSNSGTSLKVSTEQSDGKTLNVTGSVSNTSGTLELSGHDISVGGNLESKGIIGSDKLNVFGTGDVSFSAINVVGGTMNLDAAAGVASGASGAVSVSENGVLNIGTSMTKLSVGDVDVAGNVILSADNAVNGGDLNIAPYGTNNFVLKSDGSIKVHKNIDATASDEERFVTFDSKNIVVDGDVTTQNRGGLAFGYTSDGSTLTGGVLAVAGGLLVDSGTKMEIYSESAKAKTISVKDGALLNAHGKSMTATDGEINIANGVLFDGTVAAQGLSISGTDMMTLKTAGAMDINVANDGVTVADGNTLVFDSGKDLNITGVVTANGNVTANAAHNVVLTKDVSVGDSGSFIATGKEIDAVDTSFTNVGTLVLGDNTTTLVDVVDINTSGNAEVYGTQIYTDAIDVTAGELSVVGNEIESSTLSVLGDAIAKLDLAEMNFTGVSVYGSLFQGSGSGAGLYLLQDSTFTADSLTVNGDFAANSKNVSYDIADVFSALGNWTIANGATVDIDAKDIKGENVNNAGMLDIKASETAGTITFANVVNSKNLTLNAPEITADSFENTAAGKTLINGKTMDVAGNVKVANNLYQHATSYNAGDVNINEKDYTITADSMNVGVIKQFNNDDVLTLATRSLTSKDIDAKNLTIGSRDNYLNATVMGNVSEGVHFEGLQSLNISGDYHFGDTSSINAVIASKSSGGYWGHVDEEGNVVAGSAPLIHVGGEFITNLSGNIGEAIKNNQMTVSIFDTEISSTDAIWLVNTAGGIENEKTRIRNLIVKYCNAAGDICADYPMEAFLTERDIDAEEVYHSVYIVFDEKYGGPVYIYKLQPLVEEDPNHTEREYQSAAGLDNAIEGQLHAKGFNNRAPIEVIPLIFQGTNMETAMTELYDRMEYYYTEHDPMGLTSFSHLFQPREGEQFAGNIVLNEHTFFRNFEDRMFDEFLWNRNRNLKKAWLDIDYGMYFQNVSDGLHADGNRFGATAGFDWRQNKTLILGLSAHYSRTSSVAHNLFDLKYRIEEPVDGYIDTTAVDNYFGIGGYLMKTLGLKTRLYGNAFLDMHWLNVDRTQNYVDAISGSGTAFSLISEWGFMHDWLNQYLVGNLYARLGYNTGFSVKEQVNGSDYMSLESKGYAIVTPGYTLTLQKRIYPSSWFQIRPYMAIGAEYDVLGAPDRIRYKFAMAESYTDYGVDLDPLWANAGGGIEFVSATGVQIGIDYRYQYNKEIQLHNIKLSGSYRF